MKTDCTIKFNSIEEYREIEKTLEELGYENDKEWNEDYLKDLGKLKKLYVHIDGFLFGVYSFHEPQYKIYNSLNDFLND